MNFSRMKVATRLGFGFALISLLLVIVALFGLQRMAKLEAAMVEITDVNSVEAQLANRLDQSISNRALAVRNLLLLQADQADQVQKEASRMAAEADAYEQSQTKLAAMFALPGTTSQETTLLEQIRQQSELARPLMDKAKALALAGQKDDAYRVLRNDLRPVQAEWWERVRELREVEHTQNDALTADAKALYAASRLWIVVQAALALFASVVAATLITRGLLQQLGGEPADAAEAAGRVATGDLTIEVIVKDGDTTSLMHAMRTMRESLTVIVSQVHASTSTMAAAVGQIASGNLDLSARTEQQAASLEETAASMEELTATVKRNSAHARQANELAVSASVVSERAGNAVADVVETMSAIHDASQKIVDIIGVIDSIAFQTNILALNAAVEAARAGEQGRGFAVVASEVRSLAQRSAMAAKEVKALIGTSVEQVEVGNRRVKDAGATMSEVLDGVKRVTTIMTDIMGASEEQAIGIEQINQALTQMDQVTQQNASLVEEAAAAAESMREQADVLVRAVSVFKLERRDWSAATVHPARLAGSAAHDAEPQAHDASFGRELRLA
ncbi:methyl-accepting chemotaxis protein [Trinickia fusca]|uniref:Methyl-accepting chemotaxis protein n=1 Tax=Trinickia fusca TaxID=2419777 RepID=A0A494XD20_9BURK|nr:methyl-accepting chemotaxis protein [Trinickia fusca]RKP45483.1 methyl-accepting chemotaxis protein [Trinickia fusca]